MSTAALMEKIAEVAPQVTQFMATTKDEVVESPFKDEILGQLDFIVKKAAPTFGQQFGNAAMGMGATIGAGIAYAVAGDVYSALRRGITKTRNYRAMMKENPDMAQLPAKEVQKAFSTLHRFNQDFSNDPTVSGAIVRQQVQMANQWDTKMLKELVDSQKNLRDSNKLPIPGHVPWDNLEDRQLQQEHLRQQMSQGKTEDSRRGEKHKMDMQRGQADINRAGVMGPAELERLQQQVEHGRRMNPIDVQRGLYGSQMDKMKLDKMRSEDTADQLAAALGIRAKKALGHKF